MGSLTRVSCPQELDSVEATVRAVELGLGAAFLPRIAVQRELDRGNLAAVPLDFPHTLTAHISAVLNPSKYRPKAVQMLLHNLCPAAFPEPANAGSETTASSPTNGKEASGSGTASGNGAASANGSAAKQDRASSAVAAAAGIGAATGAARGAATELGTIAGAISGAASGAASSTAAAMSASNGLPGDLFFSSTRHGNGVHAPVMPQLNGAAMNGSERRPDQASSAASSNGSADAHHVTAGPSEDQQEERHRVHATAGVYNSLDAEQTSAAVEGQTQEHVRGQPGVPDLRQTAWPGFSEVLAVQSAETESQSQSSAHRSGCFIPDWSFSSAQSNGVSTDKALLCSIHGLAYFQGELQ